jgi:hypothetical protein
VDGSGNVFVAQHGSPPSVIKLDFADPPSLTFATTAVGQTSADSPKTVTMNNDGNSPLAFTIPSSGTNPTITTGFTLGGGSTCPQLLPSSSATTLASGASCNYLVSFSPQLAQTYMGDLIPTDNNLNVTNATQTVPLNGVGTLLAIATSTVLTVLPPSASVVDSHDHSCEFADFDAYGNGGVLCERSSHRHGPCIEQPSCLCHLLAADWNGRDHLHVLR